MPGDAGQTAIRHIEPRGAARAIAHPALGGIELFPSLTPGLQGVPQVVCSRDSPWHWASFLPLPERRKHHDTGWAVRHGPEGSSQAKTLLLPIRFHRLPPECVALRGVWTVPWPES